HLERRASPTRRASELKARGHGDSPVYAGMGIEGSRTSWRERHRRARSSPDAPSLLRRGLRDAPAALLSHLGGEVLRWLRSESPQDRKSTRLNSSYVKI